MALVIVPTQAALAALNRLNHADFQPFRELLAEEIKQATGQLVRADNMDVVYRAQGRIVALQSVLEAIDSAPIRLHGGNSR